MNIINLDQFPLEGGIPNMNGDVFSKEALGQIKRYLPKQVTTLKSDLTVPVPDQSCEDETLFPVLSGNRRRPLKVDPLVRMVREHYSLYRRRHLPMKGLSENLRSAVEGDPEFRMWFLKWDWLYSVLLYDVITEVAECYGSCDTDAGLWGNVLLTRADDVMHFLDTVTVPSGVSCVHAPVCMNQLDLALTSLLLLSDEERGYFAFSPSQVALKPKKVPGPGNEMYSPFTLTYAAKRKEWESVITYNDTGMPVPVGKEELRVFFDSHETLRCRLLSVTWLGTRKRIVSSEPSDSQILKVGEQECFYSDSACSVFSKHYSESIFSEREVAHRYIELRRIALYDIRNVFIAHQDELPVPHFCGTYTTEKDLEVYCWMRDPDIVGCDDGSAFILCNRIARRFRQHGIRIRIYRFREGLRKLKNVHHAQLLNPDIPWKVPGTFLVVLKLRIAREEAVEQLDKMHAIASDPQ